MVQPVVPYPDWNPLDDNKEVYGPWEDKPVIAWKPIKTMGGKRKWLTKVFRRRVYYEGMMWSQLEYGDLFDVLQAKL